MQDQALEPNILRYAFVESGPCPDTDVTVFHGTWWYGLRNIIEHKVLLESCDISLGHEFTDPGVYTSPLIGTAKQYARPQIVFNDGHCHRVVLECRVLTALRRKRRPKGGDQWIYGAGDVHLSGVLVFCNDKPIVGYGEECLLCWVDFLEAQSHRPPLVAGFDLSGAWQGHAQHAEDQPGEPSAHSEETQRHAQQKPPSSTEDQPGEPQEQKPPSSAEDQPGAPGEEEEQRQKPPSSAEDQPGEPQEQKPPSSAEDQPGAPGEEQEQEQKPPSRAESEEEQQEQSSAGEGRPGGGDSSHTAGRAMPGGADRAMPGGEAAHVPLLLQPCLAYKKVEAAVPWVHAFVEMHAAVYFGEGEWRQVTLDSFSEPPPWLVRHFDVVSGYEAPFTWENISWSLLHARSWTVAIGDTRRNLNTLLGMVNGMLAKAIGRAAGDMQPLAGLCFVELVCDLFNGCAFNAEVDVRMIVKTQPDPEAPAEVPPAKRKRVPCAAVRIETQHGYASAKYTGGRRLTTEQRRTNILRGRSARSFVPTEQR